MEPALLLTDTMGEGAKRNDLALVDEARSIAERNDEINRRRLSRMPSGTVRVVDPLALARFMKDAQIMATQREDEEAAVERAREAREGAAYRPKAERERIARERAERFRMPDDDEARAVANRNDPHKDYYAILGLEEACSNAEVKKAFKRLSLTLHPDKNRGLEDDQLAAVAERYHAAMEAYDVLSDDGRRASYDHLRSLVKRGGFSAAGGMNLTPDQAAALARGLKELAAMRRAGARSAVHPPLDVELLVSLEGMYSGVTKTVHVERRSLDSSGHEFVAVKALHVIVRRGTASGRTEVFAGQGHESAHMLPGNVVVTIRQKPHTNFRRRGEKDLEMSGRAVEALTMYFVEDVRCLSGRRHTICGAVFAVSAANGGRGGTVSVILEGEGCLDPIDPWDRPPGDLHLNIFYAPPPSLLAVRVLAPGGGPLFLASGAAEGAASVAGQLAGQACSHRAMAEALWDDSLAGDPLLVATCIVFQESAADCFAAPSPAAAAAMLTSSRACFGLRWRVIRLPAYFGGEELALMDDEILAIGGARLVLLDLTLPGPFDDAALRERVIAGAVRAFDRAGLNSVLCEAWNLGAVIMATGGAPALLGSSPGPGSPRTLLPFVVRVGGLDGFEGLRRGMEEFRAAAEIRVAGIGLTEGSLVTLDPWTGANAELLMAPDQPFLGQVNASKVKAGWGDDNTDDVFGLFARL